MQAPITIVDFGLGNLHSVHRKFERCGAGAVVTSDPKQVVQAQKLVLPGVGHFGRAMENIRRLGLFDALNEAVNDRAVPILGICLGMQLMARRSEEGNAEGFGWVDAEVVQFKVPDPFKQKVPHVGWNSLTFAKDSALLASLPAGSDFYFLHRYHLVSRSRALVLTETDYGYPFISAIERRNVFGVQFHPEKSQDAGELLLKNFAAL